MAEFNDFLKLDIRIGRIVRAEYFEEAKKPAYKLFIDFGDLGIKRSSAQITQLYRCENLVGREVVAVVNFPPKQIGHFLSEVLVLGVNDSQGRVVLLTPDGEVPPGKKVY